MENFEALKLITAVEKVLNIHRDYIFLKRKKHVFVTFLILLEFIIFIPICIDNFKFLSSMYFWNHFIYSSMIVFYTLYAIQSVFILVFAPKLGGKFKILLSSLSEAHNILKSDLLYTKFLSRLKLLCRFTIVAITLVRITISVVMSFFTWNFYGTMSNDRTLRLVSLILYYAVTVWVDARYAIGVLLFYSILAIIRGMLQTLNVLVMDAGAGQMTDNLNKCASVYIHLIESGRQLKECFGHQILLILFTASSHFVFLLYQVFTSFLLTGEFWFFKRPHLFYYVLCYSITFFISGKVGQEIQNEVLKLNRALAKICIKSCMDSDSVCKKNLNDFRRLVSVEPLAIELMPTMPVGMYLLPAVLSLTVNYTIVSLQLNHDI